MESLTPSLVAPHLSKRVSPVISPEWTMETSQGRVLIYPTARGIDEGAWGQCFDAECMDSRYYEIIEQTLCDGFEFRYALLTSRETGRQAVQPFFLVDQDIAAGLPSSLHDILETVRKHFPRLLKTRMIMVGCAAGEGRLGCCEPWALEALHEAIDGYARREKIGLVVFKDLPARYRMHTRWFASRGYRRIPSMPAAKLDFGFSGFEEYLQCRLSRVYRKSLRRKFREVAKRGGVCMEVTTDITPHLHEVYPLYRQTFERSRYRFERLTPEYFAELGRRMPDRVRFFLWRSQGRVVAFSLCMIHGSCLYDLNIGLDYRCAFELHLYFVTWRDLVTWALQTGLHSYYTGPLNYDPKLHLRLELAPLDLYVRHVSPLLNPIFGAASNFLQPARYDSAIRRFPNAHEL